MNGPIHDVAERKRILEERKKKYQRIFEKYKDYERVYLAELIEGEGNDSSEFVIAIVAKSWEEAEAIARRHNAKTLAMHDGNANYALVRS